MLLISVAMEVVAYLLQPNTQTPQSVHSITAPTADAGRPIGVVFGTVRVTSPNVLWSGDASADTYTVSS